MVVYVGARWVSWPGLRGPRKAVTFAVDTDWAAKDLWWQERTAMSCKVVMESAGDWRGVGMVDYRKCRGDTSKKIRLIPQLYTDMQP